MWASGFILPNIEIMIKILESAHIYLKAGYASCMSNPVFFTFDSVWAAPTKKSELPLKLP
jgi:hypothetical protein